MKIGVQVVRSIHFAGDWCIQTVCALLSGDWCAQIVCIQLTGDWCVQIIHEHLVIDMYSFFTLDWRLVYTDLVCVHLAGDLFVQIV